MEKSLVKSCLGERAGGVPCKVLDCNHEGGNESTVTEPGKYIHLVAEAGRGNGLLRREGT